MESDSFIPKKPISKDHLALVARNIEVLHKPKHDRFEQIQIITGICTKDEALSVLKAVQSAFEQKLDSVACGVVVLIDGDGIDLGMQLARLWDGTDLYVLRGNLGSAARARNAILDWVEAYFSKLEWIARLDYDDVFSCSTSLASALNCGVKFNALFVIGGNRLVLGGKLLEKVNIPDPRLLDRTHLLSRLEEMAHGIGKNELPSCNLLLRAKSGIRYPDKASAEDHWLVTSLLMHYPERVAFLREPFYCDYSLDGGVTSANLKNGNYFVVRQKLLQVAQVWNRILDNEFEVMGWGSEGIVIRNEDKIEKHFYPFVLSVADVKKVKCLSDRLMPYLPPVVNDNYSSPFSDNYNSPCWVR